jgi:3-oxoacyl-[acyl-carrier-protein] synthase III
MFDLSNQQIGIEDLEFYLPETRRPAAEYLRLPRVKLTARNLTTIWDWASEPESLLRFFESEEAALRGIDAPLSEGEVARFIDQTGIDHIACATDESCSDMAVNIARCILARRGGAGRGIDGLICFHSTLNEEPNSSISGRLQHELGLKGVSPFAIGQKSGNSGFMALKVACHLMASEADLSSFLLVGAEKIIPPYPRLFAGTTLIGDSASAMIVSRRSHRRRILGLHLVDLSSEWFYGGGEIERPDNFFLARAVPLIEQVFAEMKIGWRDVALLAIPNLSRSVARDLIIETGVPEEKIWTGNASGEAYALSSDLVRNLATALEGERVKRGEIVMALSLGFDFSIGCVVLEV